VATGTVIKCSREAETHSRTLRKDGDSHVCQQCYDKEHGIERIEAKGRPVLCPKCGAELMTRFRKGRVSIKSLSMKGGNAELECGTEGCGYKKTIRNPFGGRPNRDEVARQRLRSESSRLRAESIRRKASEE